MAGSMVDLVFVGNVGGPERELLADDAAYAGLLLQLAEEMAAQGIRYEPAQSLTRILRQTAESGSHPQDDESSLGP